VRAGPDERHASVEEELLNGFLEDVAAPAAGRVKQLAESAAVVTLVEAHGEWHALLRVAAHALSAGLGPDALDQARIGESARRLGHE
jgi:hypothetical protein